jgi:hypothetical protein
MSEQRCRLDILAEPVLESVFQKSVGEIMRRIVLGVALMLSSITLAGGVKTDEHSQAHEHSPAHGHTAQPDLTHSHETLEIPAGTPIPSVGVEIAPDAVSGWNIQVAVKNFKFAPEQLNQTNVANEGHAHLYVDGKKVTRLYGTWYYLGELPPGPHSVTVRLNTNRHADLVHHGQRIEATKRFIVFPAGAGQ